MTAQDRYRDAAAFRAALEHRLRADARTAGLPVDRLRKEAAFNRLLARLHAVAPDGWALKGGLALIARLGQYARATKDADVNWRTQQDELETILSAVEDLDLHDWFRFEVLDPRSLQGEGEAGGLRYPVTARLDGRLFEQLTLDINLVGTDDPRPIELVTGLRNPFAFIDEPPLRIPMATSASQLAEKLHAYTRIYHDEVSSRTKDMFDMLVLTEQVPLPTAGELTTAAKMTFDVRATPWPPDLAEPPEDWARAWQTLVRNYPLRWPDLTTAFTALHQFWTPILTETIPATATWQPDQWHWQ